jgi:hypothetical protein
MAQNLDFTLKRHNGTDQDTLYPTTTWTQVLNKPSTYTPTAHTHTLADISDLSAGTLAEVTAGTITTQKSWSPQILKQAIQALSDLDTDTNNYLTGVSGSGNGTVTFTRSGLSNLTWDASHTHSYLPLSGGTLTGTLTLPTLKLTPDASDTTAHRLAVYDSGTTSYGMMLWNTNGTAGDWSTMIYGPNQSSRRISFGKINGSSFLTHSDISEIAYFDLDDSSLNLNGNIKVGNSNTLSNEGFELNGTSSIGLRATNANGYISLTPLNTGWAHVYTDRSNFIFNKPVYSIDDKFSSYDADLQLQRAGTTKLTLGSAGASFVDNVTAPTFVGALSGNASTASTASTATTLTGLTSTITELNYVDGVTSAIQTQLNNKAPLASPGLTGTPTAPTATAGTNTTQIATTAFVQSAVSSLVSSAPEALNTLNELAAALGDDPNFATTVATDIGTKVSKSGDTMTGTLVVPTIDMGATGVINFNKVTGTVSKIVGASNGLDFYSDNPIRFIESDASSATITISTNSGSITANSFIGSLSGNASTATKLATARSIGLSGDVSGSASFDGSANISITATIADDSHNHIISNIDGLQTALDGKSSTSHTHTFASLTSKPTTLSGYGITDAMSTSHPANGITSQNITDWGTTASTVSSKYADWDTAFNWGNHASVGYLTSLPSHTLADHSNVSATAPSTGQVLKWNGTAWAPGTDNNTTYSLGSFGVTATSTELNIMDGVTATTAEINTLDGFLGSHWDLNYAKDLRATGVTTTEYDYLDGVTSNIQTQLNSKAAGTHSHGNINSLGALGGSATTPASGDYIVMSDASAGNAHTIVKGPVFGTNDGTFLRKDGSWEIPTPGSTYTSIKDWSTYVQLNGTTAVNLPLTEYLSGSGVYGIEVGETSSSDYGRHILWFRPYINSGNYAVHFVFPSWGTSESSNIQFKRFTGFAYLNNGPYFQCDDAYFCNILNGSASFSSTSSIYIWNIYKLGA